MRYVEASNTPLNFLRSANPPDLIQERVDDFFPWFQSRILKK